MPLVICVAPAQLVCLNKRCRYCPPCNLLIAHRDEVEELLVALFGRGAPQLEDYFVVGTEDRADWLRGTQIPVTIQEALGCLHDFAEVLRFEKARGRGWGPA